MADVDPSHFRQLLGRFTTGVVVITTRFPDGRPVGMTANSLASVSLQPPLISVCVEHEADMRGALLAAPGFIINILSAGQEAVSRRFAGLHEDRFDGVGYRLSPRGLVILEGTLAHLECDRYAEFEAGDHTIFVGRVVEGDIADGRPLIYYRGGYTELGRP